uniref:Uncharacterized protein n=1 Tax=Megaselia scalaris TaxID=36166 RepID=T1GSJ3_MEGSC
MYGIFAICTPFWNLLEKKSLGVNVNSKLYTYEDDRNWFSGTRPILNCVGALDLLTDASRLEDSVLNNGGWGNKIPFTNHIILL